MTEENSIEVTSKIKKTRVSKMTYNLSQSSNRRVPAIRISGEYLEDIGFAVGGYFELTINDDMSITLRPATQEQYRSLRGKAIHG